MKIGLPAFEVILFASQAGMVDIENSSRSQRDIWMSIWPLLRVDVHYGEAMKRGAICENCTQRSDEGAPDVRVR